MKTTLKMLWVEDDCSILDAVVLPLRKRGWQIHSCTNYRDAVELLSKNCDFDCYLIDLILPYLGCEVEEDRDSGLDPRYLGLKLIEEIREKFGQTPPVVAFSVVHDPAVNLALDGLKVNKRFSKGTHTSNRQICDTIEQLVAESMQKRVTNGSL